MLDHGGPVIWMLVAFTKLSLRDEVPMDSPQPYAIPPRAPHLGLPCRAACGGARWGGLFHGVR